MKPFWLPNWDRRDEPEPIELTAEEQAAVDQLKGMRAMDFAAPGIDTNSARRDREVHGATASDLGDLDRHFDEITAALWPDH
ncbi:hypothetical protein [Glycomyces tarimensis]